jgi:hypothetical protein
MSDNVTSQMSFLEHLEELRWRLLKSIIAIIFGGSFCFLFIDEIMQFLIAPIHNLTNPPDLQVLKVQGMFMIKWGVALLGGIVVAPAKRSGSSGERMARLARLVSARKGHGRCHGCRAGLVGDRQVPAGYARPPNYSRSAQRMPLSDDC